MKELYCHVAMFLTLALTETWVLDPGLGFEGQCLNSVICMSKPMLVETVVFLKCNILLACEKVSDICGTIAVNLHKLSAETLAFWITTLQLYMLLHCSFHCFLCWPAEVKVSRNAPERQACSVPAAKLLDFTAETYVPGPSKLAAFTIVIPVSYTHLTLPTIYSV